MDSPRNRGRVLWIAVLLFVVAASALKANDTAYFITSVGQFGTIDLNTGMYTVLGTSTNSSLAGLGEVGGTLYSAVPNAGTLYTVNPKSGALNPVGPSSIIYWHLGSTTTGLYAAGWPAGLSSGLFGVMLVSSPNTVSVRLCNLSGSSMQPASATYRATIVRNY